MHKKTVARPGMKSIMLKYTLLICFALLTVCLISLYYSYAAASLLVSIVFYSWLVYVLIRGLIKYFRQRSIKQLPFRE